MTVKWVSTIKVYHNCSTAMCAKWVSTNMIVKWEHTIVTVKWVSNMNIQMLCAVYRYNLRRHKQHTTEPDCKGHTRRISFRIEIDSSLCNSSFMISDIIQNVLYSYRQYQGHLWFISIGTIMYYLLLRLSSLLICVTILNFEIANSDIKTDYICA